MNAWVLLIAQYGLPYAIDLAQILEKAAQEKREPTSDEFKTLHQKWGNKTADDFLREAQERVAGGSVGTLPPVA